MKRNPLILLPALAAILVGCGGSGHSSALRLDQTFEFTGQTDVSVGYGFDRGGGPLGMNIDAGTMTVYTAGGQNDFTVPNKPNLKPVWAEAGFAYVADIPDATHGSVIVVDLGGGASHTLDNSVFVAASGTRAIFMDVTAKTYILHDAASGLSTPLNIPMSGTAISFAGDDILVAPVARDNSANDGLFHLFGTDGQKKFDYTIPAGANCWVASINAHGEAVGQIEPSTGGSYPAKWNANGKPSKLPVVSNFQMFPLSINERGTVVGLGVHHINDATNTASFIRFGVEDGHLTRFPMPDTIRMVDARIARSGSGVIMLQSPDDGTTLTVQGYTIH